MSDRFSIEIAGDRAESTIVTTFTTISNARMYIRHECRQRKPASAHVIVTLTAFSLCRDVINLFGHCDTRVMAGCTITAHDIQIMYKCASECTKAVIDGVAIIAILVGRYMINSFATADSTVMAGQAVTGICARVVKHRISKVDGVMTHGAILVTGSGRYMIREFTHTNHIVVARITVSDNTGMVIGTRAKGAQGMAVTTILVTGRTRVVRNGWHVLIEWRGKRFACSGNLRW